MAAPGLRRCPKAKRKRPSKGELLVQVGLNVSSIHIILPQQRADRTYFAITITLTVDNYIKLTQVLINTRRQKYITGYITCYIMPKKPQQQQHNSPTPEACWEAPTVFWLATPASYKTSWPQMGHDSSTHGKPLLLPAIQWRENLLGVCLGVGSHFFVCAGETYLYPQTRHKQDS